MCKEAYQSNEKFELPNDEESENATTELKIDL